MSADRELLELAAKAAGVSVDLLYTDLHQPASLPRGYFVIRNANGGHSFWNPLAEDGDALRLAVKLQLTICNEQVNAGVAYCTDGDDLVYPEVRSGGSEGHVIPDDYDATRRAIVLAAAEIGRAMP